MWWTSWILKAEPFAYSQLGLLPDEFWSLTPALYNQLALGYYRRVRREKETLAWAICILVNHYPMRGKASTLRMEQLIGHSEEEKKALLKARDKARSAKKKG